MPDTADRLAAIRARLDAVTPGPWESVTGTVAGYQINIVGVKRNHVATVLASTNTTADAAFIAHAPEDIAYLLALIPPQE